MSDQFSEAPAGETEADYYGEGEQAGAETYVDDEAAAYEEMQAAVMDMVDEAIEPYEQYAMEQTAAQAQEAGEAAIGEILEGFDLSDEGRADAIETARTVLDTYLENPAEAEGVVNWIVAEEPELAAAIAAELHERPQLLELGYTAVAMTEAFAQHVLQTTAQEIGKTRQRGDDEHAVLRRHFQSPTARQKTQTSRYHELNAIGRHHIDSMRRR